MESIQIDILDILLVLAKSKKFIFWITLLVSITAVVFSLITPEIWTSTASILPYQSESKGMQFASLLGGFGSSILGGGQEESIELITIMNSRAFSKGVIEKFKLEEYFKTKESDPLKSIDMAILNLQEIVIISFNDESGLIQINVKTKDKNLSADIANYYIDNVDYVNRNSRISKSRRNREFIEKRVNEIEMQIDSLLINLNNFQNENKVIHIEEQTKAAISAYSELVSEKTKIELQLEFYQINSNNDSQIVQNLLANNEIFKKKIESLEQKNSILGPSYQMSLDDISEASIEYSKIEMQITILSKVYEFLYPEYESAKIEEIRNLPAIEIIDRAYPAGLKTSPKRAQICIFAFIISFMLSSFLVIIKSLLSENQHIKIKSIFKTIF